MRGDKQFVAIIAAILMSGTTLSPSAGVSAAQALIAAVDVAIPKGDED